MLATGQEINKETIELVDFIFTESHSIFNYRSSSNGPQLGLRLAKQRYPESEGDAQRDFDFVKDLFENNIAFFSHYWAHLVLSLQIQQG